jgi:DNA-directed RNA polymerase subunit beta'
LKLVDVKTGIILNTHNIPYGSSIFVKDGDVVSKGTVICKWDPYNGVIVSEFTGKIAYEDLEQGQSYQVEIDEQTGFQEKVISESRTKKLIPTLLVYGKDNELIRSYNLPVGAHLWLKTVRKLKQVKYW